jgi:signal transduction histidine kinase/ligand-binding sensor domain-containing protein
MALLAVLTIVLLIPEVVHGSTNSSLWTDVPVIRTWQTKDGLPQNTVYALTQTTDGYLWVGTGGGLARFDGTRFRTFGLQSGLRSVLISAFAEDAYGVLWVGTRGGGLSRWDGARFTTFSTDNGFPSTAVEALAAGKKGELWIATLAGLVLQTNGVFKPIGPAQGLPEKHIRAILVDSKGVLWVSVMQDGIFYQAGGRFMPIERTPSSPANGVYSLFEDREGALWAGFGNGNLWRLREGTWTHYNPSNGLPVRSFECLTQGPDTPLWLGARNFGLSYFNEGAFHQVSLSTPSADDNICALYADRDGNLWMGTAHEGLCRLSRRVVGNLGVDEGLKNRVVSSVAEDAAGSLWVGTVGGGIYRSENGRFSRPNDPVVSSLYAHPYTTLATRDGSVWIAGEGFLYRFRSGQPTQAYLEAPLRGEAIRAMCEDGDSIWLGTYYSGLLRFDGTRVQVVATNGSFGGAITSIAREGPETLWVGTVNGLYRWDHGKVRAWTTADGLAAQGINALHREEEGTLWIGTAGGGLARLKNGRILNITSEQGLANDVILQIVPDDFGHLWLGCNQGLMRLEKTDVEGLASGKNSFVHVALFGQDEGMLSEQCTGTHSPTALKTKSGRLLFPTVDGIVEVDPRLEPHSPEAMPQVSIEEVRVDGQVRNSNGPLLIPPGGGRLEISYDAPSLGPGAPVHFRFRLEPVEKTWVDAGTRRTAYYPRLRPGQYAFQVSASNNHGEWNRRPATLAVTVQPFLWQTLWFQLVVALAISGAALVMFRRRITELERKRAAQEAFTHQLILSQENERKRVASDLHDGLGQDLLVLKNRLGMLAANSKHSPELTRKLTDISADASRAINEVREISQALRPTALEQVGFTRAVEWMVEQLGQSSTTTKFSTELQDIDGLLPSDQEINLYRIIQEGLSNATRHAHASRVIVEVRREGRRLHVSLFDDGKGFEPQNTNGNGNGNGNGNTRPGFGLAGMRERAKVLGGSIEIQSELGKGTRLTLTAPLPKGHHN